MCEDSETTSPPPNQQAVKRRQLNPVCPDSESSDFEAIKRAKMMAVNSQEESELSATTTMQHHSEVESMALDLCGLGLNIRSGLGLWKTSVILQTATIDML